MSGMRFCWVFALAACHCSSNEEGNVRATKLGDVSRPLAHGSPTEELRAACGTGEMPFAALGTIRRRPYLQQVTSRSATIGWVTMLPATERVEVTTADGAAVTSVVGVVEPGKQRRAGERQMWATIGGLEPDTIYCYAVVNGSTLVERTGFRTAPDAASTEPIRFLAFGDSGGGGSDQRALRDRMFDYAYDLIIHTGDLAYDHGTIAQFEDNVFGFYHELFRNLPFFPSVGNHEYETDDAAPFRAVFALPDMGGERWFSYDWGRIHFAALDTQADYLTQAEWLDADLAASAAPWKIVYMHKPPYSSGDHGSDLALRAALEPVLQRHRVQLVLAGHDHHYERMHPQQGVAHVVTGGGGRGTRDVGTSSFTAFSEEVIHFTVVEVGTDELVLHAIDATGQEFDSMVVPR